MPYLRFSVSVIALFLDRSPSGGLHVGRGRAGRRATHMPYQRGQFSVRRFPRQAEALCAALAAKITPLPATNFVTRAFAHVPSELRSWRSPRLPSKDSSFKTTANTACPGSSLCNTQAGYPTVRAHVSTLSRCSRSSVSSLSKAERNLRNRQDNLLREYGKDPDPLQD